MSSLYMSQDSWKVSRRCRRSREMREAGTRVVYASFDLFLLRLVLPDDVLLLRSFLLPHGDRRVYTSHLKQ
jgi:hypothetical protein